MKILMIWQTVPYFVLLLLCSVNGCVDSKHPLSDPEKAELHAEIIGIWLQDGSDAPDHQWTIVPAGSEFPKGFVRITFVDSLETNKKLTAYAFSTKLDQNYYLNIATFTGEVVPKKWDKSLVDFYTLMPYSISGDTFKLLSLKEDVLKKAVSDGKLSAEFPYSPSLEELNEEMPLDELDAKTKEDESGSKMKLTVATTKLRAFFAKERAQIIASVPIEGQRRLAAKKQAVK